MVLAPQAAKQLTQKDFGMKVGKLDASWGQMKRTDFAIVKESDHNFVIKANNTKLPQILFFTVSKGGEVEQVSETSPL